jgi:hypothetical protein
MSILLFRPFRRPAIEDSVISRLRPFLENIFLEKFLEKNSFLEKFEKKKNKSKSKFKLVFYSFGIFTTKI